MNFQRILVGFTLLFAAQQTLKGSTILLGDFSNLSSQAFSLFNGSWAGGSPVSDQFIQGAGFATVQPVNGGNPLGDGGFDAGFGGVSNFTGMWSMDLRGSVAPGNSNTSIRVTLLNGSFIPVANATFATADFSSTFTEVNALLNIMGDLSSVEYWSLGGDGLPSNSVRFNFDNLAASSVPEPGTSVFLAIGIVLSFVTRRRRAAFE